MTWSDCCIGLVSDCLSWYMQIEVKKGNTHCPADAFLDWLKATLANHLMQHLPRNSCHESERMLICHSSHARQRPWNDGARRCKTRLRHKTQPFIPFMWLIMQSKRISISLRLDNNFQHACSDGSPKLFKVFRVSSLQCARGRKRDTLRLKGTVLIYRLTSDDTRASAHIDLGDFQIDNVLYTSCEWDALQTPGAYRDSKPYDTVNYCTQKSSYCI